MFSSVSLNYSQITSIIAFFFFKPGSSNKSLQTLIMVGKSLLGLFLTIMWVRTEPEADSLKWYTGERQLLGGSDGFQLGL